MKQNNSNLIDQAIKFAVEAHSGQVRKFSAMPYVFHVMAVADIVSRYTDDSEVVASAILHDTFEDTPVTLFVLEDKFGKRVKDLVNSVSKLWDNQNYYKSLPRDEAATLNIKHYSEQNEDSQLIKCADMLHNLSDLTTSDNPEWSSTYLKEKMRLLAALTRAPTDLRQKVMSCMTDYLIEQELDKRAILVESVIHEFLVKNDITVKEASESESFTVEHYDNHECKFKYKDKIIIHFLPYEVKENADDTFELIFNYENYCI